MQIPDHVIVRKIREYDPYLFVIWNNQKQYFEIWRHMPHGRRLITPVTLSIYYSGAPISYCQLDERILVWLAEADSHRHGEKMAKTRAQKWMDSIRAQDAKNFKTHYDKGKDIWSSANAFYSTKYQSKNSPYAKEKKAQNNWVRPDVQSQFKSRMFSRSRGNALQYGFKK